MSLRLRRPRHMNPRAGRSRAANGNRLAAAVPIGTGTSGNPQAPPDSPSGRGAVFRVSAGRGRRNHDRDHLNGGVKVGETPTVDVTLSGVPGDEGVAACYNASGSCREMAPTRAA